MSDISLERQIHIYSVDTAAFYSDQEKELHDQINELIFTKKGLREAISLLKERNAGQLTPERAQKRWRQLHFQMDGQDGEIPPFEYIPILSAQVKQCTAAIKELKARLKAEFTHSSGHRRLRTEELCEKNIISVFESMLTRTLGLESNRLSRDLLIVQVYFFDVFRDIVTNGFMLDGQRYVCYTASAGQIRTKKAVFIREALWQEHQKTLMCGLTVQRINELGGVNVNKYLAYLALCNSATDLWESFDIRKSIVVNDMETAVHGLVDFIDADAFGIERREMGIPITHTDGCGMILPRVSRRNFMVRLPWIKGLLASFPFDKFIREANLREPGVNHGIVRDIYGREHDVLAEGIEVIFTKSQFKMWKYYAHWEDYMESYLRYGCTAGRCNEEEHFIPSAKLNYQMLQTLTDLSDEELTQLCEPSVQKIRNIAADRDTMLSVFGAGKSNSRKNSFQRCLALYPELLTDPYTRETLRQIKKNLISDARAGKIDVNGKYTFLVPDLYAFCEYLFLHAAQPAGLLQSDEVSCRLFRSYYKVDCLRSPHLYREHAVRKNACTEQLKKWFQTDALYTSCHDLISRILQFDNDGDKSLVVADPLFVKIAERNMEGVVPLCYEMAKAGSKPLDNEEIYRGMTAAYTGGKIGEISNTITKIWNSDEVDLDTIKLLCMQNNFVID